MTVEGARASAEARPRRARNMIALFAVALLAVSAVWLVRGGTSTRSGQDHLSVALTDFDGGTFTLEGYRGRPIVVNFWASWCPSCAAEMPAFEQAHQRFEGRVEFLGVNHSDRRSSAVELARSTGVTYRLAEDPDRQLFKAFGGTGMPITALIDGDGDVAEVVLGQITEDQLTSLIHEHLGVGA